MEQALINEVRDKIENAQKILLTSHISPDGDAVCSVLGMGLALQAAGKEVQMVLSDGAGSGFDHLEGFEQIKRKSKLPVDLVIGLDCADRERLGSSLDGVETVDINIDHHVTNTHYAETNFVDATSVAACTMVAEHLEGFGLQWSLPVAEALLTGMLTDTLGFRTNNMTPKALRIAADLVERGANLPVLYEKALLRRSFEAMRYWGAGLAQLERRDGLVWSALRLEDRKAAGYPGTDDAELVNAMSAIEDAQAVVLFIEQKDNEVKISWRSRGEHDVAAVATQFGGGGHKAASGAKVSGSLEEVKEKVLEATAQAILGVPA